MIKRSPKQEKTLSSLTLLFLLYEEDSSGYLLKQRIKTSRIDNYFPISETTIYKTLDKLQQDDFIESKQIQNANYPVSTVYNITPQGKQQYKHLMEKACIFTRNLNSLHVLLGFSSFLSVDEQIQSANRWKKECSAYLKELETSMQLRKIDGEDLYGKAYAEWLLILNEKSVLKTQIRWINKYIKYLKTRDPKIQL